MFAEIAEWLTSNLEENRVIQSEDRELYKFGLEQFMMIALNLITTLAIGLIFRCLVPIIVFMAVYIPLRSFAGGFHAKTPLRCYIYSVMILVCAALAFKYLTLDGIVYYALTALSFAVIFALAPIDSKNKPLDDIEMTVYRKRARIILCIDVAVGLLLYFTAHTAVASSIAYSLACVAFMMPLGKVINNKRS